MLIMILSYSQTSGNKTFINSHYGMLQSWGYYLGNNSLSPTNQYVRDLKSLVLLVIFPQALA